MVNTIISDKLYIGDVEDARHLHEYHTSFDRVVTVGEDIAQESTDEHYPIPDGGWGFDPDEHYPIFRQAVNTVRTALVGGERVFVHCRAGQSRSAAVCIAAIATLDGSSFEEAYLEVRHSRPIITLSEELQECAKKFIREYQIHFDR